MTSVQSNMKQSTLGVSRLWCQIETQRSITETSSPDADNYRQGLLILTSEFDSR